MTNFVQVGDALIDADEVISVVDVERVVRTTWYCGTRQKFTEVIFKNGVIEHHYSFTKAQFLAAINEVQP